MADVPGWRYNIIGAHLPHCLLRFAAVVMFVRFLGAVTRVGAAVAGRDVRRHCAGAPGQQHFGGRVRLHQHHEGLQQYVRGAV